MFSSWIASDRGIAKALGGDCSTVMQNIQSQLSPQVKVGILQCPQQAEAPYQHCGLYVLYNLLKCLGEENFQKSLQSFVDCEIDLTHTVTLPIKKGSFIIQD